MGGGMMSLCVTWPSSQTPSECTQRLCFPLQRLNSCGLGARGAAISFWHGCEFCFCGLTHRAGVFVSRPLRCTHKKHSKHSNPSATTETADLSSTAPAVLVTKDGPSARGNSLYLSPLGSTAGASFQSPSAFRSAKPRSTRKLSPIRRSPSGMVRDAGTGAASAAQSNTLLMSNVVREFKDAGVAVFTVHLDTASEPHTLHAIGECTSPEGKTFPVRVGVTVDALLDAIPKLTVVLRAWEMLSRSGVIPLDQSWLPDLADVQIQSIGGAPVLVTVMAAAEVFADCITTSSGSVSPTNQVRMRQRVRASCDVRFQLYCSNDFGCGAIVLQAGFLFVPPEQPVVATRMLKLEGEYVMLKCAVVDCSDVAIWCPVTELIPAGEKLHAFVVSVFRSRDSAAGTVVLGPSRAATLPGLAAGLGCGLAVKLSSAIAKVSDSGGAVSGITKADTVEAIRSVSAAIHAAKARPSMLLELVLPYLHVTNAMPHLLEVQAFNG